MVSAWIHAHARKTLHMQNSSCVHREDPAHAETEEQIHARKNKPAYA